METTMTAHPLTSILRTRMPSATAFLVAILLFLLPFAEVRCNGNAIAHNTGLGIAMGSEWKEDVTRNIFGNSSGNKTSEYRRGQDPNLFAIAALAVGIIALLIAVSGFARGSSINFYAGLLAAALLVAMLIDLRSKARSETSMKSSDLNIDISMQISVDGTPWFYLAVILFIAGAIFGWQGSGLPRQQPATRNQ